MNQTEILFSENTLFVITIYGPHGTILPPSMIKLVERQLIPIPDSTFETSVIESISSLFIR